MKPNGINIDGVLFFNADQKNILPHISIRDVDFAII